MTASGVRGIDLFKIAGRSISGWIPSLKTGNPHHVRQPFCRQLEERLLMYLEYHPQVSWYARGDIDVPPDAPPIVPAPLPDTLPYISVAVPPPASHMAPSTLGRLVQRTRALGAIACVPYGSRTSQVAFHPAFQVSTHSENRLEVRLDCLGVLSAFAPPFGIC